LGTALWSASAVLGIAASVSGIAHAQDERESRAVALFNEGRAFLEKGDCPSAVPKFLEALRLHESIGAHLSAAECYAQSDPAAAWRQYRTAERAARERGDDRAAFAAAHAAALEPRLAIVKVHVSEPSPGLEVHVDGAPLDTPDGTVAVVSGNHSIDAAAPGKKRWSRTVQASIGRIEDVRITLEEAEAVQAPTGAGVGAAVEQRRAPASPQPEAETPRRGAWRRQAGLVLGASGIAGVALGSIAGVLALTTKSDLQSKCGMYGGSYPSDCGGATEASSASWRSDRTGEVSTLRAWTTVSTVGFIAGGALLGGGAALYLTAPGRSDDQPTVGLGLWPGGVQGFARW
jgi:hypothetical protein